MAVGSLEGFLSDVSTRTLAAHNSEEEGTYLLRFLTQAIMVWHIHGSCGNTGVVFRTYCC